MKLSKRKLLVITENIEMKLFSSEETCVLTITHVEQELRFHQSELEHPLVLDCEEDQEDLELQVQTPPRLQAKPRTASPAEARPKLGPPALAAVEDIEIEMEVFPSLGLTELLEENSEDSSVMSSPSNRAGRLRWKSLAPPRTGLLVRDVLCLPGGPGRPPLERLSVPRAKQRAALAALGMSARITIDHRWSAGQTASRLAALFQGRFVKQAGQTFSFTYLQCVPGSRVLFVPDPPAEGWTGEQVLRTSGHGALYILSHQDLSPELCEEFEESAAETPVLNREEFCVESCTDEDAQTESCVPDTTEELSLDLDSVLTRFRQENVDQDSEIHVQVKRRDLLQGALQAVRRRGFCFRTPPLVSFSGEETDGHEGPCREFFRLALQELQQSCVFEGRPGRLLFSCDLAALEDRKYYEAGVLIGWSLAQGGPGPRCLHPALYQLMCGQNPSLDDFSWRDVADAETQTRLQELRGCSDVTLLSPALCDWVSSCGVPEVSSAHPDEKLSVYIKHHIYQRVSSMISQFTEGLNSCGALWDTVRSHWEQFVPVMTAEQQQQPLTLQQFKQLFSVCYSRAGGALRAAEEATAAHWDAVLSRVSDGQEDFSFEDLLAFITGADQLPVQLPGMISLSFYSQDAGGSAVRLPHASTCALQLFLPRGVAAAADLAVLLSRAVHEALGFTRLQSQTDAEGRCIDGTTDL